MGRLFISKADKWPAFLRDAPKAPRGKGKGLRGQGGHDEGNLHLLHK